MLRWILIAVAACSSPDRPTTPPAPPPIDAAVVAIDAASPPVTPTTRLPDDAIPLAYDLRLELDPASDSFRGAVEIHVRLARATDRVWLHAEHLVIGTATYKLGSRSAPLTDLAIANEHELHGFGFGATVPAGEVTLVFDYSGKVTRDEAEGLFRQQQGGKWYLYAQSESVFARRILPCFDEPRFKPSWRVTLIVPRGSVGVGNGAVVGQTDLANGRRELHLAEISKMPSYLLSVAVGPFAIVEVGKVGRAGVPARVVVPGPDERNVGVVAARLPGIVDALERYLDQPLPLAKLDLVAVPRFFGAMENIGLITFESSILVGDPKKQWVWRRFIRFSAHELAHQWFGNLVTHAWWDDLWLAEGFATWLGDKVADELGAYNDPALRRQLSRLHALDADDAAVPRPLRRPLDADDVEERFDAIAYEKGGAVLDMLDGFVGAEPFRDAIRGYVRAHAGGSATSRDVVAALKPTAPDAAAALTSFLDIAGAPVVTIRIDCSATPVIEIRASTGTVPVCIRHPDGRVCTAATPTRGTIKLAGCPAWVIGNAGGDGYYHVADPAAATAAPMTPSERLGYSSDLAAALVRGDVTLATALAELRAAVTRDPVSRLGAVSIAEAIDPMVEDALRPTWVRWLAARFAKRPYTVKLTVPAPTIAVIDGEARERLGDLLDLSTGTKAGFDKIIARAKKLDDDRQGSALENLGLYGPTFAVPLVELYLSGAFKRSRVWPAIASMLERADTRTAMWRAVRERMTKIIAISSAAELDHVVEATRFLCDATARTEVLAAFTGAVKDADAKLAKPLAGIDRCIARRATLGDLAAALKL